MAEQLRLQDVAALVRAKNAGPFWITLDVFFKDDENYQFTVDTGRIRADTIANLYNVDPDTVRVFSIPSLNVIKVSFPRPQVQGSLLDRDMHAGQQHIPLAQLHLSKK